jgi:hypothetical protein
MNILRKILSRVNRFDIANASGDVFMCRYRLVQTRFGCLYLHEILRSDEDLCLHDHPWRFVMLILSGGYSEVLPNGNRWRSPGTFLFRPAKFRHRIEVARPAWSLVVVGQKRRQWGFFTRWGWQPFVPGHRPICEHP